MMFIYIEIHMHDLSNHITVWYSVSMEMVINNITDLLPSYTHYLHYQKPCYFKKITGSYWKDNSYRGKP